MGGHPFIQSFLAELDSLGSHGAREVVYHLEIDSTSTDLKRRLEAGAGPGTVVAAARQTAGRGRTGRAWHSPPEGNLYISLAVELGSAAKEAVPFMPLAAGVAAWDAIRDAGYMKPFLKWPNDVLADGRKLAGILCEIPVSLASGVAVVGLGVNIATLDFPGELAQTAVSLAALLNGERVAEGKLTARLSAGWVAGLERMMLDIRAGRSAGIVEAWRVRAEPFGRRVRVGEVEGVTAGLDDCGRLEIVQDSGERTFVAGGIVENI